MAVGWAWAPLLAAYLSNLALAASTGEYCGYSALPQQDAYILGASWGEDSELVMDYRKTFHDVYQPAGYCVCQPGVPMSGWLFLTHKASCKELFQDLLQKLSTSEYVWPPPKEMPQELYSNYTLNGRVQVSNMYFSQKYNQNPEPHKWSVQHIEGLVQKASNLEEFSYGAETHYLYNMFDQFPVKGLHGVVLGTEMPWLEAILLSKGVKRLLTVEYQEIHSQHHAMRTLTPKGLAETWLNGNLPEFDFAVSFSSYEHDGLGRYGDPVDPWGDIWDVRRITCFVKPGGLLYLGVPMGPDQVVWNAHRIYGPSRLPLLTANWELLGGWDDGGWIKDWNKLWSFVPQRLSQPLLVLRNRRSDPCTR